MDMKKLQEVIRDFLGERWTVLTASIGTSDRFIVGAVLCESSLYPDYYCLEILPGHRFELSLSSLNLGKTFFVNRR